MAKTDRDSVERVEAFCAEAERRRDLHDRPHDHDKIFGLNNLCLMTSDLRALLARAEQAEAKLADVWDEAIGVASEYADSSYDLKAADDIRTIPNPYRGAKR